MANTIKSFSMPEWRSGSQKRRREKQRERSTPQTRRLNFRWFRSMWERRSKLRDSFDTGLLSPFLRTENHFSVLPLVNLGKVIYSLFHPLMDNCLLEARAVEVSRRQLSQLVLELLLRTVLVQLLLRIAY